MCKVFDVTFVQVVVVFTVEVDEEPMGEFHGEQESYEILSLLGRDVDDETASRESDD